MVFMTGGQLRRGVCRRKNIARREKSANHLKRKYFNLHIFISLFIHEDSDNSLIVTKAKLVK